MLNVLGIVGNLTAEHALARRSFQRDFEVFEKLAAPPYRESAKGLGVATQFRDERILTRQRRGQMPSQLAEESVASLRLDAFHDCAQSGVFRKRSLPLGLVGQV